MTYRTVHLDLMKVEASKNGWQDAGEVPHPFRQLHDISQRWTKGAEIFDTEYSPSGMLAIAVRYGGTGKKRYRGVFPEPGSRGKLARALEMLK